MSDDPTYSRFKTECEEVISILNKKPIDDDKLDILIKKIKWPIKNSKNNDLFVVGVLVNNIKAAYKLHDNRVLYTVAESSLTIIDYMIDRTYQDDIIKSVAQAYVDLKQCCKKIYDSRRYFDLCGLKIPQLICNNARSAVICHKYIQECSRGL